MKDVYPEPSKWDRVKAAVRQAFRGSDIFILSPAPQPTPVSPLGNAAQRMQDAPPAAAELLSIDQHLDRTVAEWRNVHPDNE